MNYCSLVGQTNIILLSNNLDIKHSIYTQFPQNGLINDWSGSEAAKCVSLFEQNFYLMHAETIAKVNW